MLRATLTPPMLLVSLALFLSSASLSPGAEGALRAKSRSKRDEMGKYSQKFDAEYHQDDWEKLDDETLRQRKREFIEELESKNVGRRDAIQAWRDHEKLMRGTKTKRDTRGLTEWMKRKKRSTKKKRKRDVGEEFETGKNKKWMRKKRRRDVGEENEWGKNEKWMRKKRRRDVGEENEWGNHNKWTKKKKRRDVGEENEWGNHNKWTGKKKRRDVREENGRAKIRKPAGKPINNGNPNVQRRMKKVNDKPEEDDENKNGRRRMGKPPTNGKVNEGPKKPGDETKTRPKEVKIKEDEARGPRVQTKPGKPDKSSGNKENNDKGNKKKEDEEGGEITVILGESSRVIKSKSKGKCISSNVIVGKDSAVFYSTGNKKRSKCKVKFRTAKDKQLNLYCTRFSLEDDGCSAEKLTVFDKGSKEKTNFCKDDNPSDTITESTKNQLILTYKKRKFKKKDGDFSRGFVCQVSVKDANNADILVGREEDCDETFKLKTGQTLVFASVNDYCYIDIRGAPGNLLDIDCPDLLFNKKCRKESVYISDANAYESFSLCRGRTELPFTRASGGISLSYRNSDDTSPGYAVCTVTSIDWWNLSEGSDNFVDPGYPTRGPYTFPHTRCPDEASVGGECRSLCRRDEDCPTLQYCCLNTCGRVCTPPTVLDTADTCGCSVTFLPMTWPDDDSEENARILHFIWEAVKDSFSPSMDIIRTDQYFDEDSFGRIDNLCQLENMINFDYDYSDLDLFRKPHRKLFVIGDDLNFFRKVLDEGGDLAQTFESSCAVLVGDFSLDDALLSQFNSASSPNESCVWQVGSFLELRDLIPEAKAVINDGSCLCPGDSPSTKGCVGPGEDCVYDEDCEARSICVNGVCQLRPCYVPDVFVSWTYVEYDYHIIEYQEYYEEDFFFYHDRYLQRYDAYDYQYDFVELLMNGRKMSTKLQGNNSYDQRVQVKGSFPTHRGCCLDGLMCGGLPVWCVSPESVCDGKADCSNGEDETTEACAKRVCGEDWIKCSSGQCIERHMVCDGTVDCSDGSDENCTTSSDCPAPRFHYCSSGACISPHKVCDGEIDCQSGEDEIPCQCLDFRCSSGECISSYRECDGYRDCSDGSDEICETCPSRRPVSCNDGTCLSKSYLCDGFVDCDDGSDEDPDVCGVASDCFSCASGECIERMLRCDGLEHCSDGSDESDCQSFTCIDTYFDSYFHCFSGECLLEDVRCNGREECLDGSDEHDCSSASCPSSRPLFCSSGECIAIEVACNGEFDCRDRSDETKCPDIGCPSYTSYQCLSGQCFRSDYDDYNDWLCDGESDCFDGSDEKNCDTLECPSDRAYKCNSGQCIYGEYYICDGFRDCKDGSDETNCDFNEPCSSTYDIRCKSGECISEWKLCDGYQNCHDGSDETECGNFACPEDRPFKCGSGECVSKNDVCDIHQDCKDGSDEMNCDDEKCQENKVACGSGECIYRWSRCSGYSDCRDGSDEAECDAFTCPAIRSFHCGSSECKHPRSRCNGFTECGDGSDEVDCGNFTCPANRPFKCASGTCVTIFQVCNGLDDCGDGSDEVDCEDFRCPEATFQCPEGNCIPVRFVCNGDNDCDGGADEEDCENYEEQCPRRFKCDGYCLPLASVCDGFNDCTDGSDEKDCP